MNPCFCSAGRKTRQIHRIVRSNPLQQRRWNSGGNTSPTEKTGGNKLVDRSKAFVIGSIAGTCGSLAGMGGGFIMIPLMTSKRILGLTQHQAHATSLFAVATTGLAGAVSYSSLEEENNVDARVAAAIALSGMATASLGAHASARLSQKRLGLGLGIFMLLVAPTIPARDYLLELQPKDLSSKISTESGDDSVVGSWQRYVKASAIGCFSGFLAGMFGVGGGAVVVPALSLFMDMNHYQALGTSLCGTFLCCISFYISYFPLKRNICYYWVTHWFLVSVPVSFGSFLFGCVLNVRKTLMIDSHGTNCCGWNRYAHVEGYCSIANSSRSCSRGFYRWIGWRKTRSIHTGTGIEIRIQWHNGCLGSSDDTKGVIEFSFLLPKSSITAICLQSKLLHIKFGQTYNFYGMTLVFYK